MAKVKVYISDRQKAVKIPAGIRMLIRRCCCAVLMHEGFADAAEISVVLADDSQIAEINRTHRRIDAATDVLSFPMGENGRYDANPATGALMLGDIVLSVERAVEQAGMFGHSVHREVGYLTVHSMLHLLGYDHTGDECETLRMREREEQVMEEIGLPRGGSGL